MGDSVQRDLQCCGFLSPSEWSDIFPASCCQDKCTEQGCQEQDCVLENIHINTCKQLIKSNLLQPTSVIGIIGVLCIAVVFALLLRAIMCEYGDLRVTMKTARVRG